MWEFDEYESQHGLRADYRYMADPRLWSYLDAVAWLVLNNSSLRRTTANCIIPKSSLHWFIHNKLSDVSHDLYHDAIMQLQRNKR